MSKTYTFTLTRSAHLQNGLYGGRGTSRSATFSGYAATDTTKARTYTHLFKSGSSWMAAALIMDFSVVDQATWAYLSALTADKIERITLDWSITTKPSWTSGQWRIGAKQTNSNDNWTIGSSVVTGNYVKSTTQRSIDLSAVGFSRYGYVIGANNGDGASDQQLSSATLTVVADDPPTVRQTVNSATETTASIHFTANDTPNALKYSLDGGSTWTSVPVSGREFDYTITGLPSGDTASVQTNATFPSGLEAASALTVTTYAYPYCTTAPGFVIGNAVTLDIYNPLSRSISVKMKGNGATIKTVTTTGTSVSGFNAAADIAALYASIPSAVSAVYTVEVTYNSITTVKTGGNYSVDANANKPSITGLTYVDTKAASVAITGDNTKIIRGFSEVRYTASGISAKNGASVASVSLAVNGATFALALSGTTATGGNATIDSAANVTAKATVTDSRGLTATRQVTVTMIDWVQPSARIGLKRLDNFYTETTLSIDAQYSSLNGQNTISITYKMKKANDPSWAIVGTASDNVPFTVQADNEYAWDVQIVVQDRLASTTYNLVLPRGIPIAFFDRIRNAVGINDFPKPGETLRVGGKIAATGGADLLNGSSFQGFDELGRERVSANGQNARYLIKDADGKPAAALFGDGAYVYYTDTNYHIAAKIGIQYSTGKPEIILFGLNGEGDIRLSPGDGLRIGQTSLNETQLQRLLALI